MPVTLPHNGVPGCGNTHGDATLKTAQAMLCPETAILLAVCLLDMLSSAVWFHHGMASEANPLLRTAAQAGTLPFIAAKTMTFLPALVAAEWYRRRRPAFVVPLVRWAGIAYVSVYCVFVGQQLIR